MSVISNDAIKPAMEAPLMDPAKRVIGEVDAAMTNLVAACENAKKAFEKDGDATKYGVAIGTAQKEFMNGLRGAVGGYDGAMFRIELGRG